MNKRRNTIIAIIVIGCVLLAGIIFWIVNYTKDESSFSVLEKKWITDHLNEVIDIDVYNNIPVFGYNGKGMIFDFLNYVTKENQIHFNRISYQVDANTKEGDISFRVLNKAKKLSSHDMVLFEDYYAIYSKKTDEEKNFSLDGDFRLGYLRLDENVLSKYFSSNIHLICYDNVSDLMKALDEGQIDDVVLVQNRDMQSVLSNQLQEVYHLTDLGLNYVLHVQDDTIFSILKKSYLNYLKNDYATDYSKNYLEMYFDSTNTKDSLRKSYNAKIYKYGYIVNMPYENSVNGKFVGTMVNYLKDFDSTVGTDIEVVEYQSIDELKAALIKGDIDFALGNFDYSTLNMERYVTGSFAQLEYVVLSKSDYAMNSLKGLLNQKVMTVRESLIYQACRDNGINVRGFSNTDDLLRNIDDSSIILLDKQTYLYYKNDKLKDYKINYESALSSSYRFIMRGENDTFNRLLDYYVSNIDYNQVKYLYGTNITFDKDYTTIKIIVFSVVLVTVLMISLFFLNRKSILNKAISKDEVLKYIDPMTSLKNRSYLNANIYQWDDNVIFPQGIIVFDLNKLKEVNDKLGREAGDEVIKKAASVLINNQLENTDIVRSGGDEFLVYLVGYDEKAVSEYAKKLFRLMKNIPDSYGVEFGYSMILDEVKTVDDAINESISMMMKNKEKRK